MMKKAIAMLSALTLSLTVLAGCSAPASSTPAGTGTAASTASSAAAPSEATPAAAEGEITVVSREDGSGTRGAFIELFGVEEKDADGKKIDMTTEEANITNSTAVMMTTVAGDTAAIGYISLGSLNDTVKAVQIDGVDATAENIKSGTYKISRPFNIVLGSAASEAAQDFVSFILSQDGQAVVGANGYIPLDATAAYEKKTVTGSIVIAGSSSITPVMEKLKEAYAALNPDVSIEIQQSDSTTGMQSALEGICDIGMASRELKDSEKEAGLEGTVIALDGIAVIVNLENTSSNLTAEQVKQIFTGEVLDWSELA